MPAVVLASAAVMLTASAAAIAATPRPDAYDRALAARLDAKVATFRAIAAQTSGGTSTQSLDHCAYLKKHPKDAFAAIFAILPALLVELVSEYKPRLTDLKATIARMHPHAPLFRQWLTAQRKNFALILQFDSHGKKVDLCAVATVMLTKTSSPADIRRVLGVDPALIAKLFASGSSSAGGAVARLNPKMRAFLIAAGVPRKNAVALTS